MHMRVITPAGPCWKQLCGGTKEGWQVIEQSLKLESLIQKEFVCGGSPQKMIKKERGGFEMWSVPLIMQPWNTLLVETKTEAAGWS